MVPGLLRVFYETVRLGSIRKAGIEMGLASSSVSRQISLLERQIGTTLFARTARGMEVNHAGRLVAEFARQVVLDYDALKADLDDFHGGRRAHIRIATVASVIGAGPSIAIAKFTERFPKVTFEVHVEPAPAVVDAVLAADVDIGLTYAMEPDPKLKTIARIFEPLVLLTARRENETEEIGQGEVTLDALDGLRLALPAGSFGVRRLLDHACLNANLSLVPVLESDSFEILRTFVLGGGSTVLPSLALIGNDNSKIRVSEIVDPRLQTRTIDLIVLKTRRLPRVMRLFLQDLHAQIEQ